MLSTCMQSCSTASAGIDAAIPAALLCCMCSCQAFVQGHGCHAGCHHRERITLHLPHSVGGCGPCVDQGHYHLMHCMVLHAVSPLCCTKVSDYACCRLGGVCQAGRLQPHEHPLCHVLGTHWHPAGRPHGPGRPAAHLCLGFTVSSQVNEVLLHRASSCTTARKGVIATWPGCG